MTLEVSCPVRSIMYILVHKKQGRSKTKLLNLLKRSRTDAVRKTTQTLHIKVATSYQDAIIRKIYNYCTGSSGRENWNHKISETLHVMISLVLLPFAAPHWSHFYSFQGLLGLSNITNPKWRKRNDFNICKIIKGFSKVLTRMIFSHEVAVSIVLRFTCSICLMKVKSVSGWKSYKSII